MLTLCIHAANIHHWNPPNLSKTRPQQTEQADGGNECQGMQVDTIYKDFQGSFYMIVDICRMKQAEAKMNGRVCSDHGIQRNKWRLAKRRARRLKSHRIT